MKPLKYSLISLVVLLLSTAPQSAHAADVRASVSTRETYVGLPVRLQVEVRDATKVEPPSVPPIDGVTVGLAGPPGRNTRIATINGRTTTSTSWTYSFELTPQRAGSFQVPAITIHADGAELQTRPVSFVASNSNTDDLLFAEIAGKQRQIYVGQSLDVTLRIWIRPFHDRDRNITLSEGDMWQLISDRTNWGMFSERLSELAANDERPGGKEVLRKDRSGAEHAYYLYEVNATIYPKRPGKIDASDVRIVVEYPTALAQARDPFAGLFNDLPFPGGGPGALDNDRFSPFGTRLTVQSARPIVGEAHADSIDVRAIPTAGRPADYRGAVGQYVIATEAHPIHVKAGDPLDLMIGVSGTGPMELVQAPPLADLPSVTADFKVPTEPLAGFVKGDRKVFSTPIRPRRAGTTNIPSIPFSYFDPTAGKFVTVRSEPIAIQVDPADTLALDAVVGQQRGTISGNSAPAATREAAYQSAMPIYTDADVLRSELAFSPWPPRVFALFLAPPLAVLVIAAFRSRAIASDFVARFRSPLRRFTKRVEVAKQPAEIAAALETLLLEYFGRRHTSRTGCDSLGILRQTGDSQLAVCCERFFDACAKAASPVPANNQSVEQLRPEAIQLAEKVRAKCDDHSSKPRFTHGQRPPANRLRRTIAARGIIVAVAIIAALAMPTARVSAADGIVDQNTEPAVVTAPNSSIATKFRSSPVLTLSADQQRILFDEANACYRRGVSAQATEIAAARQNFAAAAEKYEMLVSSDIANSRLYVNLGNAYSASGKSEKAIADYHRALQLDPSNAVARTGLVAAQRSIQPTAAAPNANSGSSDSEASELAVAITDYVGLSSLRTLVLVAWLGLWGAIAIRLLQIRFPWKTCASASLVVVIVAGMILLSAWQGNVQPAAIVTAANATLSASGASPSAPLSNAALYEGQTVKPLIRRGDWIQVQTATGQVGWLPLQMVDII